MHWARYCAACGVPGIRCTDGRRFDCAQCGFQYYQNVATAVSAVLRHQGQVAWLVRAREPGLGLLDLPGGFVDPDEDMEAALARELREELALEVGRGRYLFSAPNRYPYAGVLYRTLDAYFEFELGARPQVSLNDEARSLRWLPPSAVRPEMLAFDSLRTALPQLQALEHSA